MIIDLLRGNVDREDALGIFLLQLYLAFRVNNSEMNIDDPPNLSIKGYIIIGMGFSIIIRDTIRKAISTLFPSWLIT
jgi:hypothetical protein